MDGEADPIAELVSWWRSEGMNLNPPASDEALDQFERAQGLVLPTEFRKIYRLADGMRDDDIDMNFFHWWPLEEIGRWEEQPFVDSEGMVRLPFGDWSLHAIVYSLSYSESRPIPTVVSIEDETYLVPRSVTEFAALLMDPTWDMPGTGAS